MCEREQRGMVIANGSKLKRCGYVWQVPSESGAGKYSVSPDEQQPYCSCLDFETHGHTCKHIYAVRITMDRMKLTEPGTGAQLPTPPERVKRKTYSQKWSEYNAAQVNEKRHFQILLRDLCQTVNSPVQVGRGRRMIPRCDAIFSAVFKVYSTISARRFMTDLTAAHEDGFIERLPCYNSIFNALENPELTPILTNLITRSALPMRAIESDFAVDSSVMPHKCGNLID